MVADPAGWLRSFLTRLDEQVPADVVEEIHAVVTALLARAREPWPEAVHDRRGLVPD